MPAETLQVKPEVSPTEYEIIHRKSPVFYEVYERKSDLKQQTHYCPGCGHGVVHKLVAEAIEELGLQDRTILVSPVGCSVFAYYYFDVGNVQVAHGRAPAAATGLKRSCPDKIVIAYQGDGDLAAIGTAEIVHAANRGEKIAVIFVNNAIYGMTGGQMAPTTLVGQKTTTSPWGRRPANEGYPLHVSELLATLRAPAYIERVALSDNKNIMRARRAIRKAIENQRDGVGFSFVEILSPCPTIWGMDPVDARRWVADKMVSDFPLGVFLDRKPEISDGAPPQRPVAQVLEIEDATQALSWSPRVTQSLPPDAEVAEVSRLAQTLAHADGVAERSFEKVCASPKAGREAPRGRAFRKLSLKIAGFGGQGVLVLGQLLTEMGMREGLEVSWLPSYGPEMRSGSAHCHVCLSHDRIGSPVISHPDVLIAMNEISLRKFAPQVPPEGMILYNSASLPADFECPARVIPIPASEIADKLGSVKSANIVLMGALLEETQCLAPATALEAMNAKLHKASLQEINRQALEAGRRFIDEEVWTGPETQPDGFA